MLSVNTLQVCAKFQFVLLIFLKVMDRQSQREIPLKVLRSMIDDFKRGLYACIKAKEKFLNLLFCRFLSFIFFF